MILPFIYKSPLLHSLEHIKDPNQERTLIVKALTSQEFDKLQTPLRKAISTLSAENLGKLFDELVQIGMLDNSLVGVSRALQLLTKEELKGFLSKQLQASKVSPQETMQAYKVAEREYSKLMTSSKDSLLTQGKTTFIKAVRNFIDGCLISFHVVDMGQEISTPFEATEKYNAYSKIFAVPLVIFTALCATTSVLTAFVVTGIIVSSLAFTTWAYVQWIQDSPNTIEPFVNLLEEAKEGNLSPVLAREVEIDQVLANLARSQSGHRSHPLLIGPSGVGKSEIVKGIAQRLALGNVPNVLQGKKLLSINTAELLETSTKRGASENALQRTLKKMDKKKHDYIVFFDEVHVAKEKKVLGERLLTVLDTNPNSLPFCIGATTSEMYSRHIEPDLAFSRRWTKVDVKPLTKEQTILVLREMNKAEAPEVAISEKMLTKIYDVSCKKMPGRSQPESAKMLLSKVIASTQAVKSPRLHSYEQELAHLSSRLIANPNTRYQKQLIDKIQSLEQKVTKLKAEEEKKEEQIRTRVRLIRFKTTQTDVMFKLAASNDEQGFLFWNYYLLPHVESKIANHEKQHKSTIPLAVDAALIEQLV